MHSIRPTRSCGLLALLALFVATSILPAQQAGTSPVKIFILAGQSNMLGQGEMSPDTTPGTLGYLIANDPGRDYQFLVDGASWAIRDDVWIRDQDGDAGGLTAGYGSNTGTVGPEIGFGHHAGDLYERQVLIVKAAWGGKSLAVDFRPPSSGGTTGFYYTEVLRLVDEAIDNLGTYFPDYNAAGGYEIAGFCWHQGWNDRVDAGHSGEYETNMANFIRDMRTDLGVPGLPFVIATTGMDGGLIYTEVEQAQLAMANTTSYPEFADNVAVINTRSTYDGLEFWQPAAESPADQGYHWNRNAKTYLNIGLAMGDAMSTLSPARCPSRLRATGDPSDGVALNWQNGTDMPTSVQVLRDSAEIAAAAEVDPPTFLDEAAEPGLIDYELVFTMPGDPCDPLTVTFNGGITGLEAFRTPAGVVLNWTNNMAYDGIEIRRDGAILEAAYSGNAEAYTDTGPPVSGLVRYTVVPTHGTSTAAEVRISLDGPAPGNAPIYEPFDYETGGINGLNGGIGFTSAWSNTRNGPVVDPLSKTWGSLVTAGNHIRGNAWSGLVRSVGSTLADAGLMADGATLWFSVVFDLEGQNASNADLNLCLGTDYFAGDTFGDRENLVGGEGIGVTHSGGTVQGVYWQNSDADDVAERVENNSSININPSSSSGRALIVGRIDWGASPTESETLTLYGPDTDLNQGSPAMAAWTIPALDQSEFDSLALQFKDTSMMDEIRFGATAADVLPADAGNDYDTWAALYDGDLSDPGGDLDGDGLSNDEERIWGLDPTDPASSSAYATVLDGSRGFSYTRRDPSLSGLSYSIWTSTNLTNWQEDTGAGESPGPVDGSGIQEVSVTLSASPSNGRLFVQVRATE